MKRNHNEDLKELRKVVMLGMQEASTLCLQFRKSSVPKPEYLFQLSKDEAKIRIAKMIEVLRRNDPQFENILDRHLYSNETLIAH